MASSSSAEDPDFRMADNMGYILNHGKHLSTVRLNLQYFLWQRILKFTIHSSVQLPPNPKIADVATGTALWPLDVAHELPTAQLHGYDVDLTQAPAAGWLPANVKISEWDIFQDPPAEAQGIYDLVHVRLLILVLPVDPLPVIRRLHSLLKPGGWLQWEDLDLTRMHVKRVTPDTPAPSLDGIIEMSKAGGRYDWAVNLPKLLTGEGFVEAELDEFGDPTEMCRALNDQHLMTMTEFASSLLKNGKGEAANKVLDMVREGYKESLRGAAICYPRVCCVARKT